MMTKLREPGSIDEAMAMIAGTVPGSWKAMADHIGYEVSTVRKWGDEDQQAFHINLPAAIALDILFQEHGGEGTPLYSVYGHLLSVTLNRRYADQFELIRRAAAMAREMGEAEEALLMAAMPGADAAHFRDARKELLDAYRAIEAVLPLLDGPAASPPPPEEHSRAPP